MAHGIGLLLLGVVWVIGVGEIVGWVIEVVLEHAILVEHLLVEEVVDSGGGLAGGIHGLVERVDDGLRGSSC